MAKLTHEIWEETVDGMVLHSCCLAGQQGDACRHALGPNARLLQTFDAGNHFEAMTIYNQQLGREPYTSNYLSDFDPYPHERARQSDPQ
jgi:hypothetical protein